MSTGTPREGRVGGGSRRTYICFAGGEERLRAGAKFPINTAEKNRRSLSLKRGSEIPQFEMFSGDTLHPAVARRKKPTDLSGKIYGAVSENGCVHKLRVHIGWRRGRDGSPSRVLEGASPGTERNVGATIKRWGCGKEEAGSEEGF